MDITEEKREHVSVLALKGRLDANTSSTLEQKLLGMIANGDKHLVLDMADLDYISSAGLRVLLIAAKKIGSTDGKLGVASPKDHVREVFDLSGFTDILDLYATRDEAVAGVK